MISQQGYEKEPQSPSVKILFLTGFLFAMLVFNGFSANIVTTLTSVKSLKDFEQLINYPDMKFFAPGFEPFKVMFRQSVNEKVITFSSFYNENNLIFVTNKCKKTLTTSLPNHTFRNFRVGQSTYFLSRQNWLVGRLDFDSILFHQFGD